MENVEIPLICKTESLQPKMYTPCLASQSSMTKFLFPTWFSTAHLKQKMSEINEGFPMSISQLLGPLCNFKFSTHLRPIWSSNLGGPVFGFEEAEPARASLSLAPTTPVLSVRFFAFISSVTFLRPEAKKHDEHYNQHDQCDDITKNVALTAYEPAVTGFPELIS